MRFNSIRRSVLLALLCCITAAAPAQLTNSAVVPPLTNYTGVLTDLNGKPLTGVIGVTFYLYENVQGGAPLWMEVQNVKADRAGHYTVTLGATTHEGLPANLFASGEARWLGVQVQGQEEQPRVMLLAVPYALKAKDAETIGGLPPSAFMLAPGSAAVITQKAPSAGSVTDPPPASSNVTTTGGTVNAIPLFTTPSNIQNSILTQTATTAVNVGGKLNLPAVGTATATAGKNSRPETFVASAFNKATGTAVPQMFQLQGEPAGNNTGTTSGTLNLLYASGSNAPAETGLKISSKGLITFAAGQTFPGTGDVTAVNAGTALTGGGATGAVTLNVDTTKVPLLAAASNTFSGNQVVNGSVTAGSVSGGSAVFSGNAQNPLTVSTSNTYGQAITVTANGSYGYGIYSKVPAVALYGESSNEYGVWGVSFGTGAYAAGLYGDGSGFGVLAQSTQSQALWAETTATGSSNNAGPDGVHGVSHSNVGSGVAGINDAAGGIAVYGRETAGGGAYAGRFDGDVWVNGNLSKGGGSFKIDHPLDPSEKYLYHSFVESPDMKNIYDGVVMLDAQGEAVIEMPDWFSALNRDFRYQLTCIGGFAPVYVAEELTGNKFKIGGGRSGMKVSWQITGIRQDAWANAHRIPIEERKPAVERGTYLHPELFGAPQERAVGWGRYRFPDGSYKFPVRDERKLNPAAATRGMHGENAIDGSF